VQDKYQITDNRESYIAWEQSEGAAALPLFMQSWWLDTVVDRGSWSGILVRDKADRVVGALPWFQRKMYGMTVSIPPLLSPYQGPFIQLPEAEDRSYIREKTQYWEITGHIAGAIQGRNYLTMHLLPGQEDWLPFSWQGFKQSTRYTFRLDDISDPEKCFACFKGNVRTNIRKAEQQLTVIQSDDTEQLYHLMSLSYSRNRQTNPVSAVFLDKLYSALKSRDQGRIFLAVDQRGDTYGAIFTVQDKDTVYILITGVDTSRGNVGAVNLLYWEALRYYSNRVKALDFEGSMLPGVAPVFLSFGARLIPYLKIYSYRPSWLAYLAYLSGKPL
jgi:hypothetical protein